MAITLLAIGLIVGSLIGSYGFPRTITETLTETTTITYTKVSTTTITKHHYYTETVTTTTPAWRYTGTIIDYEGPLTIKAKHYGYEIIWVEKNYKIRVTLKADNSIRTYIFTLPDYASWVYGKEVSPIAEKRATTIMLETTAPTTDYYTIIFYNDQPTDTTIYNYKIEIQTPQTT